MTVSAASCSPACSLLHLKVPLQLELMEVVDFFLDPDRFRESGARIPRGVLLGGPPGNGKTLLARAVAGESGVAFLSMNASEFVEMYVGVGAARVRDLFQQVGCRLGGIFTVQREHLCERDLLQQLGCARTVQIEEQFMCCMSSVPQHGCFQWR